MKKSKWVMAGVVVLFGICLAGVANRKQVTQNPTAAVVDGSYILQGDADGNYRIQFNADTMTYETINQTDEGDIVTDSGSYTVDDGKIYTFSETDDANSRILAITDGQLTDQDNGNVYVQ